MTTTSFSLDRRRPLSYLRGMIRRDSSPSRVATTEHHQRTNPRCFSRRKATHTVAAGGNIRRDVREFHACHPPALRAATLMQGLMTYKLCVGLATRLRSRNPCKTGSYIGLLLLDDADKTIWQLSSIYFCLLTVCTQYDLYAVNIISNSRLQIIKQNL